MNQHCSTIEFLPEYSSPGEIITSLLDEVGKHPTNNILLISTKNLDTLNFAKKTSFFLLLTIYIFLLSPDHEKQGDKI